MGKGFEMRADYRVVFLVGVCGLSLTGAGCKGSGAGAGGDATTGPPPPLPTNTATAPPTATATTTAPPPSVDAGVACNSRESRALTKRDLKKAKPKIVGGRDSSLPWVVAITVDGTSATQYCGGSLIGKEWVLTAAHCEVQKSDKLIVGRTDLKQTNGKVVGVADVKNHAAFDTETQDNDITVVKLAEPVDVETIGLYSGSSSLAEAAATVAGWGYVKEGGPQSTKLLEVDVPVVSNATCSAGYASDNVAITENMLCAGLGTGGKDSCQGDSGGPLAVRGAGNKWQQAGVVSFGIGCARPNKYGVYTRVSKYGAWIDACTR